MSLILINFLYLYLYVPCKFKINCFVRHVKEIEDMKRKLDESAQNIQTLMLQTGEYEKVQHEFKLKASESEQKRQVSRQFILN